jgi:di/tricarboxylate transporter
VSAAAVSVAVLGAAVVLFVWNRVPAELVAVGAALALYAAGVLRLDQALAGFGDPTVLFVASVFVVGEALAATGVTAWVGQGLVAWAGDGRVRLPALTVLLGALLAAVVSVNGAVAALFPVVVLVAVRSGRTPSRLLLPLAFGAHAGSLLALTGAPANAVVSNAAAAAGARPFGYFEYALVGVPLVLGTLAVVVLFGERLLPARTPRNLPPDFSEHLAVLTGDYRLERLTHRLRLGAASPLVGRTPAELAAAVGPTLSLVGVQMRGEGPLTHDAPVGPGDVLLVRGAAAAVGRWAAATAAELETPGEAPGAAPPAGAAGAADAGGLFTRLSGVAEVVIRPRSGLIGTRVFPGMVTESGALVVQAVQRGGAVLDAGETVLAAGDALLVRGTWAALAEHTADPDVLVVDAPERVRRQVVPLGPGARPALAVLAGMVLLLATGAVPAAVAGLLAAGALVALRVVTPEQAHGGVAWSAVVLVAGMVPVATALRETGAAAAAAAAVVEVAGGRSPHAAVFGLVLLTAALTQVISTTATALIVTPVAVAVAAELGVSVLPVLLAVNVAAVASFLTPVATPANLLVQEPGAYRFGDYWRLGLPLLLLFVLAATVLVPLLWPF